MKHPDNCPYVFQWHVEGPAGPIGWTDVNGIRTYGYWAPMKDVLADTRDESNQTWGQFCDELQLPDEKVRDLYPPDARVKSWDQLTHDLALPEEWGFRTQLSVRRLADDVDVSAEVVGPVRHTLDAGRERGGDKGLPWEGRRGAREIHFDRQAILEGSQHASLLARIAAETGRHPSEVLADLDMTNVSTPVCTCDIPSRLDELDRRVRDRVGPPSPGEDPKVHKVRELEALNRLLGKEADLRYRDLGAGGILPDYNSDGTQKYDQQGRPVWRQPGTVDEERHYRTNQSMDESVDLMMELAHTDRDAEWRQAQADSQQASVDQAIALANLGRLDDSARQGIIDLQERRREQALQDMAMAMQRDDDAGVAAAKARVEQAEKNEKRLTQDWKGPNPSQSPHY